MPRAENRGFRRALRCLRRQFCSCVRGEPTESGSEYTTTDASGTGSEPASMVSEESASGRSDTTLHTATEDQTSTSTASDHSVFTLAPTVETSSPVESYPSPDEISVASSTPEDERAVAADQKTSIQDRAESDEVLEENVKDYVHELMERVISRMSSEEAGGTSPVQENSECKLTQGTVESSSTEYYSCFSEIITTTDSTSSNSMEEKISDKSHSSMEEQSRVKSCNSETQTRDEPHSAIEEQSSESACCSTVQQIRCEACSSMLKQTRDEACSQSEAQTKDEHHSSTEDHTEELKIEEPHPEQMMEQQNTVEPNSSTEEQSEDKTCSVDELSKNDISTHSANTPFSGEELAKRTPTSESDDIETPDTAAAVIPTKPQGRNSVCVFEVVLVGGLLGLGLTLASDDFNDTVIQKIRPFSSATTQGDLRVGDRILKISGSSVIGKSPTQVQRVLSGVKWGEEVKILAMPAQETVAFRYCETANAGVIIMKLNTSADNPLGLDVEGGSDTNCPYVCISYIQPGSVAKRCGMLRVGDELVQIDQHLMVGTTHSEAVDILRHIHKPITLTVQRRHNLNLKEIVHM